MSDFNLFVGLGLGLDSIIIWSHTDIALFREAVVEKEGEFDLDLLVLSIVFSTTFLINRGLRCAPWSWSHWCLDKVFWLSFTNRTEQFSMISQKYLSNFKLKYWTAHNGRQTKTGDHCLLSGFWIVEWRRSVILRIRHTCRCCGSKAIPNYVWQKGASVCYKLGAEMQRRQKTTQGNFNKNRD